MIKPYLCRLPHDLGIIRYVAIALYFFRTIQRGICCITLIIKVVIALRSCGPKTDRDRHGDVTTVNRFTGNRDTTSFSNYGCFGSRDVIQNNQKLITAHPREKIVGAQASGQSLGNTDQHPVPNQISIRVIRRFEMINIDTKRCHPTIPAFRAYQGIVTADYELTVTRVRHSAACTISKVKPKLICSSNCAKT